MTERNVWLKDFLWVVAPKFQIPHIAAEFTGSLDNITFKSLVRDRQGRGHPGNSPAYNQSFGNDINDKFVKRF